MEWKENLKEWNTRSRDEERKGSGKKWRKEEERKWRKKSFIHSTLSSRSLIFLILLFSFLFCSFILFHIISHSFSFSLIIIKCFFLLIRSLDMSVSSCTFDPQLSSISFLGMLILFPSEWIKTWKKWDEKEKSCEWEKGKKIEIKNWKGEQLKRNEMNKSESLFSSNNNLRNEAAKIKKRSNDPSLSSSFSSFPSYFIPPHNEHIQ